MTCQGHDKFTCVRFASSKSVFEIRLYSAEKKEFEFPLLVAE